jgi:hypothetical protein
MRASNEVSIDLTAQEALEPPPRTGMVEVDDIGAVEPATLPESGAANSPQAPPAPAYDETIEIELTAEQMDTLLVQIK